MGAIETTGIIFRFTPINLCIRLIQESHLSLVKALFNPIFKLLGFGANNKKNWPTQPSNAQDLSRSNVVKISGDGDYAPTQALMMKPT
jgi:hypothetical protein